jgi:tripartite-type tricarboxylate transporter receptor subunit TctC
LCAPAVASDDYPSRPIRFLVPYPPGGGNDVVARAIAQKLAANMGQPVVIENRAGATGMVAGEQLSRSAPDGYTIMIDQTSIVVNPALFPKVPFDVRQLTPITQAVNLENLLLVNAGVPAQSVADLIRLAKDKPGTLTYASTGSGGPQHLAMEQFKRMAGVDIIHVPYKGGAPATLATVAGEVQMLFISITTAMPHVKSGRLRALATAGGRRNALLPDVPTVAESGLPGYSNTVWLGIFAPPKTPAAIVSRLHAEFVRALGAPDLREQFARSGIDVVASTPDAFARVIAEELVQYERLVREANIKPD